MLKLLTKAVFIVSAGVLAHGSVLAVGQSKAVTITADSNVGRALKAPDNLSREQQLAAKPLDWNVTRGKPSPQPLSAEEQAALKDARPQMSDAGKPAPGAAEEARRLFPDEQNAQEDE